MEVKDTMDTTKKEAGGEVTTEAAAPSAPVEAMHVQNAPMPSFTVVSSPVKVAAQDTGRELESGEELEDEGDEDGEESCDDDEEGDEQVQAKPVAPVSDLDVAARYAELEIQSMATKFATTVVDTTKPAPVPPITSSNAQTDVGTVDAEEDSEDDDDEMGVTGLVNAENSSDESSDEDDEDDRQKLRAEIEEAMEKEETKASGPLKTVNEVAAVPVREPEVELTPDCPIKLCGTILSVSKPSLMVTIKSDSSQREPMDEGSVLCFENRTILGCVDEIFGPVLMPMYLVRFESESKMPVQTEVGKSVYCVTEHTTHIVPDSIRDKGTDASNIFDEETDEAIYSDDEAEAAAKRQHRKRNRGENVPALPNQQQQQPHSHNRSSGAPTGFTDYQTRSGHNRGGGGSNGGRGRGRGRGYQHDQGYQRGAAPAFQTPVQAQPHGGYTRYTTPGYTQPVAPMYHRRNAPPYPMATPAAYGGYPAQGGPYPPQYSQSPGAPFPSQYPGVVPPQHQHQHQHQHQQLPVYPPIAPPPNYYAPSYTQPRPYGAPPGGAYYPPNDPNAAPQFQHHHVQPPPPPPSGPSHDQRKYGR